MDGPHHAAGLKIIRRIEVQAQVASTLTSDVTLQLSTIFDTAHIAGYEIDGNLQLQGTPQDASLKLKLTEAGQGNIQLRLKGSLANETLTATIEELVLNHPDSGQWSSKQVA